MNASVRELFLEIADVPQQQRERILAERPIPADLRAEVESLLQHDSESSESFAECVSDVAQEALHWSTAASRSCGPYRLVRLLGSGGMGAVYLAERSDGELEHQVAIKLLRSDSDRPSWRNRFLRERQFLAHLNHPSIARLLNAGHTEDGRPYLVMEYVDGIPIDEYAASLDLAAQLRLFLLVCDGVSHAHMHAIIHRDLKPSNILVDSAGQPKLLDFGIARVLDPTADDTRTMEMVMTPNYASPEQLSGQVQSAATDIYSLGAVLHKLVTGRSPREVSPDLPSATRDENGSTLPSRSNPSLPRDIDYIVQKALRRDPNERYVSVDAFADDVRAFLESRPVQARSWNAWYCARKFLRRHTLGVAAVAITLAALLLGLQMARHQRAIAQARFRQVRQLANKVFALDEVVAGLHGSSQAMRDMVALSKEQLETLAAEARTDQVLALELVEAWSLVARAQGICAAHRPGERAEADDSLRKAAILLVPILTANPVDRRALLIAARISHDRMLVAANDGSNTAAVDHARQAVHYLDRLLERGDLPSADQDTVSELFYSLALTYKNLHRTEEGIDYARRSIQVSRLSPNAEFRLSLGLSMLADLLRLTGDLDGALVVIREARAYLDKAHFPSETERRSTWSRVLGREGKLLGVPGGISLNRPDEAAAVLQKAFDLVEEWSQVDHQDAWSRLLFVSLGRELGDTLSVRHPRKALAVYDHALRRVREVRNHPEARRGEAELLAASSYALRRLNRAGLAAERIDAAFRLLAETKDYPSDRIVPHEAAHTALRASGDHLAGTGHPQLAAEVYEDMLRKLMASKPDVENDLPHALAASQVYGSLAALHRRNGHHARARALSTARLELWRRWEQRLPDSGFVRRQLRATSAS